MRVLVLGGLLMLAACGGGTTGTNYSEAPPVAEIVATPTPRPSETPSPEAEEAPAVDNSTENGG